VSLLVALGAVFEGFPAVLNVLTRALHRVARAQRSHRTGKRQHEQGYRRDSLSHNFPFAILTGNSPTKSAISWTERTLDH
jgi:hypothetical protein